MHPRIAHNFLKSTCKLFRSTGSPFKVSDLHSQDTNSYPNAVVYNEVHTVGMNRRRNVFSSSLPCALPPPPPLGTICLVKPGQEELPLLPIVSFAYRRQRGRLKLSCGLTEESPYPLY